MVDAGGCFQCHVRSPSPSFCFFLLLPFPPRPPPTAVNSAYNTGIPQKRRIQDEMIKAAYLMELGDCNWRALFQPSDFFNRHANFLQITIRAGNAGDFMKWFRLCESRLRILVCSLETSEVSAWPFARFMRRGGAHPPSAAGAGAAGSVQHEHESVFFIGLRFAMGVETSNLKQCTSDFLHHHINSWEERREGMDVLLAHVVQRDLPFDLINENLCNDYLSTPAATAEKTSVKHGGVAGSGGGKVCDGPSQGSNCRRESPTDRNGIDFKEEYARLSPKLALSTISDIDLMTMMSPSKRPRNNPMLD